MVETNKKLAIDVDRVVFPVIEAFQDSLCRLFGVCNLPKISACFDLRDSWPGREDLSKEIIRSGYDSIYDKAKGSQLIHERYKPYPGSQETLESLDRLGYQIYFLTARTDQQGLVGTKQHLELIDITNRWIKKHFPYAKGVLYSKEKFEYANDFLLLLDDSLENCQNWIKAGGLAIAYCSIESCSIHRQDQVPVMVGWSRGVLLDYIREIELNIKNNNQ